MSGFLAFSELNVVRTGTCPLFLEESFWSGLLVALDFYPSVVTVAFFVVSLYEHEFYLFLLSLCLAGDTGVNIAMQFIIQQPGPFPGCGTQYEMPSFATQHASVLVCMLMSFMLLWRLSVPSKKIFLLFLFLYAVILARVYCGINTRWQLLAGALVGLVEGLVYQSIIYFLIYPRYKGLLSWKLMAFLDVKDTLLSPEQEEQVIPEAKRQPQPEEALPLVQVQETVPSGGPMPMRRTRRVQFRSDVDSAAAAAVRASALGASRSDVLFMPRGNAC